MRQGCRDIGVTMEHGRIEVPLEAACPPCEERTAPRFTLLIRAAKLVSPKGEFICVIRDVSETGISLRGFHALTSDRPLFLELQTGERYEIEQVWNRGMEAGFRFVEPVEVDRLIAEAGHFPKRKLRLNIPFDIELGFLGRKVPAAVSNISQQGARIACDTLLAIDQPLRIVSARLPEVRARVRWRRDSQYGLVFDDTFSLAQLAQFAAAAQDSSLIDAPECQSALRR